MDKSTATAAMAIPNLRRSPVAAIYAAPASMRPGLRTVSEGNAHSSATKISAPVIASANAESLMIPLKYAGYTGNPA